MRSIGKWKIKKLDKIIREEWAKACKFNYTRLRPWGVNSSELAAAIDERIPAAWFNTWESAWSEIEHLKSDGINNLINTEGRKCLSTQ